ncbi:MAG TPA: UbiA family prenyltransferase [Anaerolineales bacterium]|nr:UbiA family prenyltransferase [Anaerolineales bacterium]
MTTLLTKKAKGIIQIFRPELPAAAGACVILGGVVAQGGLPSLREIILGFLCGFFISGSAIVWNDYFDLEVDRVNTPERPLPMGLLSPTEAVLFAAVTALLGLWAAWLISLPAFVLCVIFWIIGFLYNWKFKEAGLAGNLMVSASVGITFILGGMAAGEPWNRIVWCFAAMAFFIDLGEEIAGDAMDMEGDKKRASKSIALQRGRNFALAISSSCFALAVTISLIPALLGWMGTVYLILICLTDILIAGFTIRLLRSRTPAEGRTSMRGIYLGAMLGVLAAILGQVL